MLQETFWNIEIWPLESAEIETRCNERNLWIGKNNVETENEAANENGRKAVPHYWDHDVATIDSRSDRICLLMGVLSFLNGRWELRDQSGSVECVAVDRDCQQFRDRCIFTSKFAVHRESFLVGDSSSTKLERKIYISIEEFHAASLPLAKLDVDIDETSSVDGVRFLALNKSLPQMVYSSTPATRHVFGYLIVASLHGQSQWTMELDRPSKRAKKERRSDMQTDEEGPANCILLVDQDHPTLSYPTLVEGRVYEIRLTRRELLANP